MKRRMLGLVILALAGLSVVLVANETRIKSTLDQSIYDIDRMQRLARWRLGWPQSGTPDLANLQSRLKEHNLTLGAAILVRIFKQESELELWMQRGDDFTLFATYPICRWSGSLGPKLKEGDHQTPEGFYTVARRQLNPNSRWHRSFNIGFPNVFDRAFKRTGSFIMVHGGCSSVGCYAVTNPAIDEIWRIVTAAFKGGQARFQVHAFPFRMTGTKLAAQQDHKWFSFWQDLKPVHDQFEQTKRPPVISVCNKRYLSSEGAIGSKGEERINRQCPAVSTPS